MDFETLVGCNKSYYGLQKKVNDVRLGIRRRRDTIDVNVFIIHVKPII
jgi:hypothetical protein